MNKDVVIRLRMTQEEADDLNKKNSFFSVVGDKSLKDKNIRSKHRKRVPTSVFSPPALRRVG